MNNIEVIKQALEALDDLARYADTCELFLKETHPGKADALRERVSNSIKAITALRTAIEQAEKQVANSKPLTRSQINEASREAQVAFCLDKQPTYEVALARAVEAKHGITGGAK